MSTGETRDEISGQNENEEEERSEAGINSDVWDWASQSFLDSLQKFLDFDE